jgi:chitinase
MHTPLQSRARFRALLSASCCAALGVGLLVGAGTATATTDPAEAPSTAAAGSKVVGYFTDWGSYGRQYYV